MRGWHIQLLCVLCRRLGRQYCMSPVPAVLVAMGLKWVATGCDVLCKALGRSCAASSLSGGS